MIQLIVVNPPTSSIHLQGNLLRGDPVWVRNEAIARELIESGICKLPGTGPKEAPQAGPSETKERGAKKFSGEAMHGRSIASPSSSERGKVRLSSASAAALVSPQRL